MAAIPNKKNVRSTKEQINYLCRYMTAHPEFAAGDYRSPLGARKIAEEWVRLKHALDELGPQRTVDQWKICWRDQKRKARVEGGEHSRATIATGNSMEVPEMSENADMVLSAIGAEMAIGMGPDESPIGFRSVTEEASGQLPPPLPQGSGAMSVSESNSIEIEVIHQPSQRPAPKRRVRRSLPADKFLNAQLELNGLIRDLIIEVRRSNELREEQIKLLGSSPSASHSNG